MNCEAISAMIDDHQTTRLEPPQLQAVGAHLAGCTACAAIWAAHEALHGEDMGEPPPQLLARVLDRVADARVRPRVAFRRVSSVLAAAAAVGAVVVAATRFLPAGFENDTAPELAAPVAAFVAGRDYEVLAAPATLSADGKIAVTGFFDYGCFHCYTQEADVVAWEARTNSFVALTRVPVAVTAATQLHARAFYAAAALGKLEALHTAVYEEIHARRSPLASSEALAELFARFDVDAATFGRVFASAEVDAKVREAASLARRYGIVTWPRFVVAGRYSTGDLAVVDQLVADEAAQREAVDGRR